MFGPTTGFSFTIPVSDTMFLGHSIARLHSTIRPSLLMDAVRTESEVDTCLMSWIRVAAVADVDARLCHSRYRSRSVGCSQMCVNKISNIKHEVIIGEILSSSNNSNVSRIVPPAICLNEIATRPDI